MIGFPLVMTAAVDPRGMPGLSVSDVPERSRQYLGTFRYYLENPAVYQIVFVENSGYDLLEFRDLAYRFPLKQVEFLSCDLNDYPRQLGKSYGEMRILDYVVDHSRLVSQANGFTKVTGRFPILNLDALLKEAEFRRPWELFCDNKDHRLYDLLHLGWNGHACDTRFFLVSLPFYKNHFYGRFAELDDSSGKLVEQLFFQVAKECWTTERIVRRFWTEPVYSGRAGHAPPSIIGVSDYDSGLARFKRAIRRRFRRLFPWFWF